MSIWQPPTHWLQPPRHWQLSPAPDVHDWLLEKGSLTTRLVSLAAGDFRVALIRQQWARPAPEEADRLQLACHRYALIREVALLGHNQPWVRARSIIPISSLTGAGQRLRKLGRYQKTHLLVRLFRA